MVVYTVLVCIPHRAKFQPSLLMEWPCRSNCIIVLVSNLWSRIICTWTNWVLFSEYLQFFHTFPYLCFVRILKCWTGAVFVVLLFLFVVWKRFKCNMWGPTLLAYDLTSFSLWKCLYGYFTCHCVMTSGWYSVQTIVGFYPLLAKCWQ